MATGASENGECEALRRVSILSHIQLSEDEFYRLCEEFPVISEFLSRPARLISQLINVEPLYHPHDIEFKVREVVEIENVEIEDLVDTKKLRGKFVVAPWGVRS